MSTHVAFADECGYNAGRFRSIAAISCAVRDLSLIRARFADAIAQSGIKEAKWEKLRTGRDRYGALRLLLASVDLIGERRLRVDVLAWDTMDSRHQVRNRDDIGNLQRMYFHLFRNVLVRRWPSEAIWALHPDEHSAIDWEQLETILDRVSTKSVIQQIGRSSDGESRLRVTLKRKFGIEKISPVKSEDEPLVQVADLFAGLAVFSRASKGAFDSWRKLIATRSSGTPHEAHIQLKSMPSSEKERSYVLLKVTSWCKDKRMQVVLSDTGLTTTHPNCMLNFWWYMPQHSSDKAPRRGSRQ